MLLYEFNNLLLFFFSTHCELHFGVYQLVDSSEHSISSAVIHSGRFSFNDSNGVVRLSFFVISLRWEWLGAYFFSAGSLSRHSKSVFGLGFMGFRHCQIFRNFLRS